MRPVRTHRWPLVRRHQATRLAARPARTPVAPLLLALITLATDACGTGRNGASHTTLTTSPAATAAPTTVAPATTATRPPTTQRPAPTGVGTVMLDVVDATRPTVQNGRQLAPTRRLPTIVRYPAIGPVGAEEVTAAPPAPGPWPLVVFAHGYNVTPATYSHLLHAWAAAGFVVAAPAFPLETAGGPLDENDLSNEPADLRIVISTVLAQSAAPSGTLTHLVDARHIAVTGHSDGAEAALAAGFAAGGGNGAGSGAAEIGPVISMAAQGIIGGPRPDPRHPLLVVQGDHDTINPPARGDAVYRAGGPPKYELRLLGAGHLPPVANDTPWRPIVEQECIDFLRRSFGGPVNVSTLIADGTKPGLSTLTADP